MREYSFVQNDSAIYRIFGDAHPDDSVMLLLRYYWEGGRWHKPPTYSAERVKNSVLPRYDLPRRTVAHYGITLGVGSPDADRYVRYFDPLAPEVQERIVMFTGRVPCPIGLSGSRLVGTEKEGSDLDLVIYGENGPKCGRELLRSVATDTLTPVRPSIAFERFFRLVRNNATLAAQRNVYTGVAQWNGKPVKLDINYARSEGSVNQGTLAKSRRLGSVAISDELVVEDAGRFFFPGYIVSRSTYGKERVLWIRDHAARYLLTGDKITGYGFLVSYNGAEHTVICDLRRIEPRKL